IATPAGWVEAARLDRPPAVEEGEELPGGREGMASGRTIAGGWSPPDLRPVPDSLKAPGIEWRKMELRAEALDAFRRMIAAAAADGVGLGIYSAYRSVEYQRGLYLRAVDRDPRQRSSAAPGRSEHHLGTTVDIVTPEVPPLRPEIADSPAGAWIARRAAEFGIVQTYSRERHAGRGATHEPWHLRWVGDRIEDEEGW
ncbi:MAG TPA: M15 family metallopeptidase, partial [bacterium]|nr:M15 family metallopeptidase [bacterium]